MKIIGSLDILPHFSLSAPFLSFPINIILSQLTSGVYCEKSGSHLVTRVGNVVVLYRPKVQPITEQPVDPGAEAGD